MGVGRISESKEHWQLYDSNVVFILKVVSVLNMENVTNVDSTTPDSHGIRASLLARGA